MIIVGFPFHQTHLPSQLLAYTKRMASPFQFKIATLLNSLPGNHLYFYLLSSILLPLSCILMISLA
jgi:hypothetical protein